MAGMVGERLWQWGRVGVEGDREELVISMSAGES